MDILQQYEKQFTQESNQVHQGELSEGEHGFLVKAVMRMSRGRIQNAQQANLVLLSFAIIMLIIMFIIFFGTGSKAVPLSAPANT